MVITSNNVKRIIGVASIAVLVACGGGGGSSTSSDSSNGGSSLTPSSQLANICDNGATEKSYLRSFVDETYLWYADVPTNLVASNYATPQDYFDVLKTPKTTASGKPVDQFHWSQTTASWNAQQSGISEDYGIQWAAQASSVPRKWIVAEVAPNSPAAQLGIRRGYQLKTVDGYDFVYDSTSAGINALNEALFPSSVKAHTFGFDQLASATMTPATITAITVQNVKTITTSNGKVGYFTFDEHIAKSEAELIAAINQLKAAQITDLVIDMRYNGGGLLYIASELAYMIAGPTATSGKAFERLTYNDKLTSQNQNYAFFGTDTTNQTLPYLGLNKVTIITSYNTASASESVINGLRGVDVAVTLIGSTTRGKPYGFVPQGNCSYTYFSIQFKGLNNKGFGDYADGFAPTCTATDDFTHARGDAAEASLASALSYIKNGSCPVSAASQLRSASSEPIALVRPPTKEMRILTAMPSH